MRVNPPPSDTSETLVALVGSSPTPPLLSALTFTPRHLVLVHSADTARRAGRIAALARRLCPRIETAEPFDLGRDVYDFAAVEERFAKLPPRLGAAWRLCYTGGTKVMSVVAVLNHFDLFPDRHDWRSYLDATTDGLRFTDGSTRRGGPDSAALSLAALAELHGVSLLPTERLSEQEAWLRGAPIRLDPGAELEARALDLFRGRLSGTPGAEVIGCHHIPDPGDPRRSIGDFDLLVRYRHRVLCVEVKNDPGHILDAAGWTVTKAKRAFGSATRVLFAHGGDPGACSRARIADYDPGLNGAPLHVRALTELEDSFRGAGDLLEEFFTPRRTTIAPRPAKTPATATPAGQHPGRGDGPLLLMGLGGSRLGALAAAHAYLPSRAVLLHTPQSEREVGGLDRALRRALLAAEDPNGFAELPRRRLERRLHSANYRDRVKFGATTVDAADAAHVAALAEAKIARYATPDTPLIVDITTGTKAMSTGLALAAHARGGCVTYLSPVTRRVSCRVHGTVGAFGHATVDWPIVLRGYAPLTTTLAERIDTEVAARQVDVESLDAATAVLREHVEKAGHEPTVWADRSVLTTWEGSPLPRYSAEQRPTVVVTVADRVLGLAAPRWRRLRRFTATASDSEQPLSPGDWAHAVCAATARLHAACGVAGLTLALHRPGAGSTRRILDLIDWLAWKEDAGTDSAAARHGQRPRGRTEEITEHEETLRPKVVSAEPGTAEFRARLGAHLRGLGV